MDILQNLMNDHEPEGKLKDLVTLIENYDTQKAIVAGGLQSMDGTDEKEQLDFLREAIGKYGAIDALDGGGSAEERARKMLEGE